LQFQYFNQPCFTHLPEKFQYHPTAFSGSIEPKAGGGNNLSCLGTYPPQRLQRRLQISDCCTFAEFMNAITLRFGK
jgi:hypothetical protein